MLSSSIKIIIFLLSRSRKGLSTPENW